MKVHKVELYVVDFDEVGTEELKNILENSRYPNKPLIGTGKGSMVRKSK